MGDALELDDAVKVLDEWSPEEEPGEYSEKLQSGLEKVHVGTLFHVAQQHGWQPKREKLEESDEATIARPGYPECVAMIVQIGDHLSKQYDIGD